MTCPHCRESAKFKCYSPKNVFSLFGTIRIHRGYYHCKHCHQGHYPWDKTLRLSPRQLTPGLEEIVTLAGIQESFGKAADRTLRKLAGVCLSESTVQRTTEEVGARLGEKLEAKAAYGPATVWEWNKDANDESCAYVSVDATGVMMQGENAAKADGRMVYVGMIYNPQPCLAGEENLSKPCEGARYLAGLYTLAELGQQLRRQAAHVGISSAQRIIALSDGGSGLEKWIDDHFPLAVKILDFRHASDYVNDFARKYRSGDEARALMATWCHALKHEGGAALIKTFEGLDRRSMSQEAQTQLDKTLNYLRNNVERMNYPEYVRKGWQIGSGAMESACKTVVNQRLCMGGMRWGESGSDGVCHLRALYRSDPDQWDAFWGYAMAA